MNWPHLHLALNHVPVLGTIFLFLLLPVAVFRKSEELKRISLQGLLLLAAISIPIKFTGDFAHEAVQKEPGFDAALIGRHEQAADQATTGIFLTGIVALAGLIAARKQRPVPTWAMAAALITSLLTFALMLRAAQSGGVIRHPEIRDTR